MTGHSADEILAANDPALAFPSAVRHEYPEPQEKPPAVNFLTTVTRLIKSGELATFISKGIYPAPLHEALSELQRKAETATAFHLLDKAADEAKDSEMRLVFVTAFNIACWSEQRSRMSYKPVKPVQNETFEFVSASGSFKLLVEEVLQNKDAKVFTTCWAAWGRRWSIQYEISPKIKFSFRSGPCLDYTTNCIGEIKFVEGDSYTTTLAPGLVTSLASSPQVFSYRGLAHVTNTGTGLTSETDLTEPGLLSSGKKHQVKGVLKKEGKMASGRQLTGQWDKELLVRSEGSPDVSIWRRDATPSNVCRYGLSATAIQLNALSTELASVLPPTDSRLRPDVRALDEGLYSKADEELPRVSAMNDGRVSKGEDLTCKGRWFEPAAESSYLKYRYSGKYWEAREARIKGDTTAWDSCPDVFGLG